MTKGDDEDFKNATKFILYYIDANVKVRDHCHISEKYRGSTLRDYNSNVKVSHKTPNVFLSLKNCDLHLVTQELQ